MCNTFPFYHLGWNMLFPITFPRPEPLILDYSHVGELNYVQPPQLDDRHRPQDPNAPHPTGLDLLCAAPGPVPGPGPVPYDCLACSDLVSAPFTALCLCQLRRTASGPSFDEGEG